MDFRLEYAREVIYKNNLLQKRIKIILVPKVNPFFDQQSVFFPKGVLC